MRTVWIGCLAIALVAPLSADAEAGGTRVRRGQAKQQLIRRVRGLIKAREAATSRRVRPEELRRLSIHDLLKTDSGPPIASVTAAKTGRGAAIPRRSRTGKPTEVLAAEQARQRKIEVERLAEEYRKYLESATVPSKPGKPGNGVPAVPDNVHELPPGPESTRTDPIERPRERKRRTPNERDESGPFHWWWFVLGAGIVVEWVRRA